MFVALTLAVHLFHPHGLVAHAMNAAPPSPVALPLAALAVNAAVTALTCDGGALAIPRAAVVVLTIAAAGLLATLPVTRFSLPATVSAASRPPPGARRRALLQVYRI